MILTDLHTHTTYCDGKNTPEEMVRSAISLGMMCLGFSGHGYAPYDTDSCMPKEAVGAYLREIARLKEKYAGQIELRCGVEQDYFSKEPTDAFEYVIGSVHYLRAADSRYLCIDDTPELMAEWVRSDFGGDWYAMCEAYYALEADVVRKTGADIIGHFDLVTKFNENSRLFDENEPRYVRAWQAAVDALLPSGVPFEINTGAMSRGWRTSPYPAKPIRDYIRAHGGRLILSSDSHRADTLLYAFDQYEGETT